MNLYTEEGNLTSPNYPEHASNREECDFFVKVAPARSIRFVFLFFDTEENKDELFFGPGPTITIDENDFSVRVLSGNLLDYPVENRTFIFDSNQVWFNWLTDKTISSDGFFMTWDSGKFS